MKVPSRLHLRLAAANGKRTPRTPPNARKGTAKAQTPPGPAYPTLALYATANAAKTAVFVCGRLAWTNCEDLAAPVAETDEWQLVSEDAPAIHAMLRRLGIFDQLVASLAKAMDVPLPKRGPLVWTGKGFVSLRWLARNTKPPR